MRGDVFVDTNVWLYALVLEPGQEAKQDCAKQLIAGSFVAPKQANAEAMRLLAVPESRWIHLWTFSAARLFLPPPLELFHSKRPTQRGQRLRS